MSRGFFPSPAREFHKKRWPLLDFMSQKIAVLHHRAFARRRGLPVVMAGWDRKTGNGTMHVVDVTGGRLLQARKIEHGYMSRIMRGKQAREFNHRWYSEGKDERR